jgi:hypothetical protein
MKKFGTFLVLMAAGLFIVGGTVGCGKTKTGKTTKTTKTTKTDKTAKTAKTAKT